MGDYSVMFYFCPFVILFVSQEETKMLRKEEGLVIITFN